MMTSLRAKTIIFLLLALAAFMLLDYKITRTLTWVALLLFLVQKEILQQLKVLFSDALMRSFLIIFLLFVVGLLWSQDISRSIYVLKRESLILSSVLIFLYFSYKQVRIALGIIFVTVFCSEIIYLLEYFDIADLYVKSKTVYHYPFIHRMYFTTIVAFLLGYTLLKLNFKSFSMFQLFYAIFGVTSLLTLIVMEGRSGYVNLFIIITLITLFKFRKHLVKTLWMLVVALPLFFTLLYQTSHHFKQRIDVTIQNLSTLNIEKERLHFSTEERNSLSCRVEFGYYTLSMIKENPLLGVGTGDSVQAVEAYLSPQAYKQLREDCGLHVKKHFNVHNLYMQFTLLFGIVGLLVLLYSFFLQLQVAWKMSSMPMFILILPTMVSMLTQSALFTSHYFIAFYAYMLTLLYIKEQKEQSNS
jgi:O-antigen ligase